MAEYTSNHNWASYMFLKAYENTESSSVKPSSFRFRASNYA